MPEYAWMCPYKQDCGYASDPKYGKVLHMWTLHCVPAGIYLLIGSNRSTRTGCETYSKLAIKTPERCQRRRFGVFIVNFERISQPALMLLLINLNM